MKLLILNRVFRNGVLHLYLYKIFWFLASFSKKRKGFLPVLSKLSQASLFKIFQMRRRWFPCTPPPLKSWGSFVRDIDYSKHVKRFVWTWTLTHTHHLGTLESWIKFCGISDIFDVFMTSSMSDVDIILQFLAIASV